jgi:hypothetical protein
MALLQAARAYALGLPEDKAKSWGLNRAIFYAAAKRGFICGGRSRGGALQGRSAEGKAKAKGGRVFELGDEKAYQEKRGNRVWFAIGDDVQEPRDYDRQIALRFGDLYGKAWKGALEIVKQYDKATLRSQRSFYEEVYKPRRDELAAEWSSTVAGPR